MERELLDTFEAAKKAADGAASGGGSPEVDRCVDALRQLRRIPVTMKDLVATQVGKRLRYLKKHPNAKIQTVASDLLEFWKTVVIEETNQNSKKNGDTDEKALAKIEVKSERAEPIKVEKISKAGATKTETAARSESVKVERLVSPAEKAVKLETIKIEKNGGSKVEKISEAETIRVEREMKNSSVMKRPSSTPIAPPKLTSLVKCNDPLRDKLRELLAESFSRVSDETCKDNREEVRNIVDEVDACDPIRIAIIVESVMFEKLGRSNGTQKMKIRSIMFNLRDGNNPDLRRRVLLGHVKPERLVDMSAEEMASDDRKLANKQIKEKALFECERAGAPKATTDQFKCGRCGQRKTTYYQMQTRSADEPMTTFVTCVNCNNHWKFC